MVRAYSCKALYIIAGMVLKQELLPRLHAHHALRQREQHLDRIFSSRKSSILCEDEHVFFYRSSKATSREFLRVAQSAPLPMAEKVRIKLFVWSAFAVGKNTTAVG